MGAWKSSGPCSRPSAFLSNRPPKYGWLMACAYLHENTSNPLLKCTSMILTLEVHNLVDGVFERRPPIQLSHGAYLPIKLTPRLSNGL